MLTYLDDVRDLIANAVTALVRLLHLDQQLTDYRHLPRFPEHLPSHPPPPPPPRYMLCQHSRRRCSYCGVVLHDQVDKCPHCGGPILETAALANFLDLPEGPMGNVSM